MYMRKGDRMVERLKRNKVERKNTKNKKKNEDGKKNLERWEKDKRTSSEISFVIYFSPSPGTMPLCS